MATRRTSADVVKRTAWYQRAVEALVRTVMAAEGWEHTMSLTLFLREGKLQNWKKEVTRKPIDDAEMTA